MATNLLDYIQDFQLSKFSNLKSNLSLLNITVTQFFMISSLDLTQFFLIL